MMFFLFFWLCTLAGRPRNTNVRALRMRADVALRGWLADDWVHLFKGEEKVIDYSLCEIYCIKKQIPVHTTVVVKNIMEMEQIKEWCILMKTIVKVQVYNYNIITNL